MIEGVGVSGRLFTSESVTEGHPDKIADQISDAVLDAMIKDDPASRVAVETMITTGQVHIAGEVKTETYVDIPQIVRETILGIGYDSSRKGFDGESCGVSSYNCDFIPLLANHASGIPTASPVATTRNVSPNIIRRMVARPAPRARRTPISPVRWPTM